MDTLLAGHRIQRDGNISEVVVVQELPSGQVEIELATFDENYGSLPTPERDRGMIARSFLTIPANVMDAMVRGWKEKYPEGMPLDEAWTDLSTDEELPDRPLASAFLGKNR